LRSQRFSSQFLGDRHIAFERDQAVWIANLDGTAEKKIADGIFPVLKPGVQNEVTRYSPICAHDGCAT
jgi:Rieske Fe-S protein